MTENETARPPDPRVIAWGDYTCPFSYLAEMGVLVRLREDEGVRVAWRPYELWPAPAPLPDPSAAVDADRWQSTVLPLAARLGIELRRPSRVPRTRKAHEAVAFATRHGLGDALRERLYRAHFVEGRDIGRVDVIVELGAEAGLDDVDLKIALDLDTYADEVAGQESEAEAAGVTGVPALSIGDELLLGLHPYETVLGILRGGGEERSDG
jgi:predicted DsbA family dithiol-disulfide isomerase